VPEEVRRTINFVLADRVEDVIKTALEPAPRKNGRGLPARAKKKKKIRRLTA